MTEVHCWKQLSTCQTISAKKYSILVHYQNSLYLFGGVTRQAVVSDLHEYDLIKKQWRKIETTNEPPKNIVGQSGVLFGSDLVLFGGFDRANKRRVNVVYTLDLNQKIWTKQNCTGEVCIEYEELISLKIPEPRYFHSSIFAEGMLIIFGGWGKTCRLNVSVLKSNLQGE